jgi:hypothetical protein
VDGGAISGTALKLRQAYSLNEAAGKAVFWRAGIQEGMRLAAKLDMIAVGSGVWEKKAVDWDDAEGLPKVELKDGLPEDDLEAAQIVQTLTSVGAMSAETAVRRVNPDKAQDDEWVQEELARIEADEVRKNSNLGGVIGQAVNFNPVD